MACGAVQTRKVKGNVGSRGSRLGRGLYSYCHGELVGALEQQSKLVVSGKIRGTDMKVQSLRVRR